VTGPPDRTWLSQAACRDEPSNRFIDPTDDGDLPAALTTCQRCPVREPCLHTALSHRVETDVGIWGGTTEAQRREIRRGRLQPEVAPPGDEHRTPTCLQAESREPLRTQTRRSHEIPRLAAPEVTVARNEDGDYASADSRVLIFRIQGDLPWVLAIDEQIIGASRTVTEARRTAWTALHEAERAAVLTPPAPEAQTHGQRARRR
jgi:WhiB family redox-sensing transcriptional regulator